MIGGLAGGLNERGPMIAGGLLNPRRIPDTPSTLIDTRTVAIITADSSAAGVVLAIAADGRPVIVSGGVALLSLEMRERAAVLLATIGESGVVIASMGSAAVVTEVEETAGVVPSAVSSGATLTGASAPTATGNGAAPAAAVTGKIDKTS